MFVVVVGAESAGYCRHIPAGYDCTYSYLIEFKCGAHAEIHNPELTYIIYIVTCQ